MGIITASNHRHDYNGFFSIGDTVKFKSEEKMASRLEEGGIMFTGSVHYNLLAGTKQTVLDIDLKDASIKVTTPYGCEHWVDIETLTKGTLRKYGIKKLK